MFHKHTLIFFYFSLQTTERNLIERDREQVLNSLNQICFVCVFLPIHWMKNQVSALRNLDGILLKLKVYVKFPQGFRCVNIKFPQSVNLSPLSFGMVSASGIIELTRLKLA